MHIYFDFFIGGGFTIKVLCNMSVQIKFKYGIYASLTMTNKLA